MKSNRGRSGFTLSELLVVVVIVFILASILLVGINRVYSHAMQLQCQHNMEQVWHACLMYSSGNHGILPEVWNYAAESPWYKALADRGYLTTDEPIQCPLSEVQPTLGSSLHAPTDLTETQKTMYDALRWLAARQDKSGTYAGRWRKASSGTHSRTTHNAITGLCLLAFVGAGINDTHPEFGDTVRLAVEYLSSSLAQDKATGYYNNGGGGEASYYTQGVCTMAICEAAAIVSDSDLRQQARQSARLAFDNLCRNQNDPYGGYVYGGRSTNSEADTSVTSWCYQGVAAGIHLGLTFEADDRQKADNWLAHVLNEDGSSGYRTYGNGNWHPLCTNRRFRMTPAALAIRLLFGHKPTDADCIQQAHWLHTKTYNGNNCYDWMFEYTNPSNGDPDGPQNDGNPRQLRQLYYVYYMTLAMFLMGDQPERRYWSDWEETFIPVVLNAKTPVGEDQAYWPTSTDQWLGRYGGAEMTTALACLSFQMSIADYLPGSKWYQPGLHSYGYNSRLGLDARSPAADTIVLMDYTRWAIRFADPGDCIAPRHGGRVNVMFADGRVEALYPDEFTDPLTGEILPWRLTPEPDRILVAPE